MGVRHMLERRLELNGGLMTADLGVLRPDGGGQILECSLRLEGLLPERRVALELELLEGDACRGVRMITLPPHHSPFPRDLLLTGIRFYLPDGPGPRDLTVRAEAHYVDRNERCLLAD